MQNNYDMIFIGQPHVWVIDELRNEIDSLKQEVNRLSKIEADYIYLKKTIELDTTFDCLDSIDIFE